MKFSPRPRLAAALLMLLSCLALPAFAQRFVVSPANADVVVGQPLELRLAGLPAGAEITVTSTRAVRDFFGRRLYQASARFEAGADGTLDLATAPPRPGGSYERADLRGLFWAMAPLRDASPAAADAYADGDVRLVARTAERELATQTLRLRSAAAALQWREVGPALPGAKLAWLAPAGGGKLPAVIALGGSEGGAAAITAGAALLASHGVAAVLALPYYSPPGYGPGGPTPPEVPGLPGAFADIPVERLEQVRAWLARQPEVDASRIAVHGTSKGAEFALLAATRMPWIKSVVAVVPSDVVWEGWGPGVEPGQRSSFAWRGQPLPFVPYEGFDDEFKGLQTGQPVIIRRPQDRGRAANPDRVPAARIPVEAYAGPVLVIGSHADQVWDSGSMAEAVARSRAAAGRRTVALVFADAGHALGGTGWQPTTQYDAGPMKMGGSPAATARAQAEAFARTLAFLRETLAP